MCHRDGDMLFDATAADPELRRYLGVRQAIELVQPERPTGSFGQGSDRRVQIIPAKPGDRPSGDAPS